MLGNSTCHWRNGRWLIVPRSGVEGRLIFYILMTGQESLKVITKRPNVASQDGLVKLVSAV